MISFLISLKALYLIEKDILKIMIAKTYGIYDSVQEEYVQTFTCKNDAEAKRTAEQIVRTPNFDNVSYKDRSLHHLFDIDTSTGQIVNNNIVQAFLV